ncbi:MAG: hypothetical protein WCK91_00355 [bacterium]
MKYKYTRLSLYYLALYLSVGAFSLLFLPDLFFKIMHSNVVFDRETSFMLGAFSLGLFIFVAQVIRFNIKSLYTTVTFIRFIMISSFTYLYLSTHNPLFISLVLFGGIGLFGTVCCYTFDYFLSRFSDSN